MADIREVDISVTVDTEWRGSHGTVEELRYEGTIDLDKLHEVLMREFPELSIKE